MPDKNKLLSSLPDIDGSAQATASAPASSNGTDKTSLLSSLPQIDGSADGDNKQSDISQRIADVESDGGDYSATNPASTATGKYQFLWGTGPGKGFGDDIKKVTGVRSRQEFLDSPSAQETYFKHHLENNLKPAVQELKPLNKDGYDDDQLAMLVHFKGKEGAKQWLTTHGDDTQANNTSIEKYIGAPASVPRETNDTPAPVNTPLQSTVNGTDPAQDKQALTHANEYMNNMLGADPGTDVAPSTVDHKAVIANEVGASRQFIATDAAKYINSLPPQALDLIKNSGIDVNTMLQNLTAPTGGEKELSTYYKMRTASDDQSYQQKKEQLENERDELSLPMHLNNNKSAWNDQPTILQKNREIDQLNDEHQRELDAVHNATFNLAATKSVNTYLAQQGVVTDPNATPEQIQASVNTLSPHSVGSRVQQIMGGAQTDINPNTLEVDPAKKAQTELAGYQAMKYSMADAYAQGNMPLAAALKKATDNSAQKVLNDNPEFKKTLFTNAISKEVDKRSNTLTNFMLGTGGDKAFIDKTASEMGIRPEDYKDIQPGDIYHDPGMGGKFFGTLLKPIEKLSQGVTNVFFGDKNDGLSDFWNNSALGKTLGLNATPDNSNELIGSGSQTDTDANSETYGQPKAASKFNLGWNTIGSMVQDGVVSMIPMVGAQKYIGEALEGANLIKNAKVAEAAGLATYTFLTGYDDNYQKAKQAIGDDPDKEAERVGLATLYNTIETGSLQILPAKDVADKWMNTTAGKELIDLVEKKGISKVSKDMAKPYIINGLKEGLGDLGKGVSMGIINQLGDNVADMAFAPDKYAKTDVLGDLQNNAITGAIQMLIPTVGGGILHARSAGPMYKNAMMEIGTNPGHFVDDVNARISSGEMTKDAGAARIKAIRSIADIYQRDVPNVSAINGEGLTLNQQKDYGANIIAEQQLQGQKDALNDPVQQKILAGQIDELQKEREGILHAAGEQPTAHDNKIKVSEMVGRSVLYHGEPSTVSVDPETNRVIITNTKTGQEYDNVGNILHVGDDAAKDLGIEEVNTAGNGKTVVSANDAGNIEVRGKEYSIPAEHAENPLGTINYDNKPGKKGIPVSVTLDQRTASGGVKKVTFRGNVAEDIMYQLHLQKLDKENSHDKLEQHINTDEEAGTQMEAERSAQTAKASAASDNAEVPPAEDVTNKDLSSPNKDQDHGKNEKGAESIGRQEDGETSNGQDQNLNGRNKGRGNVGDEHLQDKQDDGRKVRNEQQRGVRPATNEISGPAPVDATNPFGFESESTGPHDLFHQPLSPPEAPAGKPEVTFTTSKGSKYTVNEEGGTIRDKAPHDEPGHEGTEGLQSPSSKTYYVTKDAADKLSEVHAESGRDGESHVIADIGNGKIAVGLDSADPARHGKFIGRTAVEYSTEPKVGLHPIEVAPGKTPHFGNEITSVNNEGAKKPVEDKPKPVAADLSTGAAESTAEQNRKEGIFEKDGHTYVRNEPLTGPTGKEGQVQFADGVDKPFTYQLMDAGELQPAHSGGNRNPNFFIPEAQPKERSDAGSIAASDKISHAPDLNKVGESPNAYSGAPVVNDRGEVIQGNNRSEGLKKHYNQKGTSYKSQLTANAEKYGFTKEQVRNMKDPVLVRKLNVPDEEAIKLGNHDAKDIETGGKTRIDPVATSRRISPEDKQKIIDALVSDNDAVSLNASIKENIKRVYETLKGYLSASQVNAMFDRSGELTPKGVEDVEGLVTHFMFDKGDQNLPDLFDGLPHRARQGLLKSLPKIFGVSEENSIIPAVQNAIIAHNDFKGSGLDFDSWKNQQDMFRGNKTPLDTYSPLELRIAEALSNKEYNQTAIKTEFTRYAELVNGSKADIFGGASEPISKEDAINEVFKISKNDQRRFEKTENAGSGTAPGGEEVRQEAKPEAAEAVAKEDVPVADGGQDRPAQVAGGKPKSTIEELTAEHNKINDLYAAKQREIELLEERKTKMLADKETLRTEKGRREMSDVDAQLDRAGATLKSRKNLLTKAERELQAEHSKLLAAEIRSRKKKVVSEEDKNAPVKNSLFDDKVVSKIGAKMYNASLETMARAVEAGQSGREALQTAVDYINDRHFTSWGEKEFKENLGDDPATYTAENLRNKKISLDPLSENNRRAADHLVERVRDDKDSLQSAMAHLDALKIDDATREKIRNFVRQRIMDEVHKATGERMAEQHLKDTGGDFEEAIKTMGDEFDTNMLNANSQQERENLRSKYAAAKSNLESQHTVDKVKNGELKPVYHPDDKPTGPQFSFPKYEADENGELTFKGKRQKAADDARISLQDKYSRLEEANKHVVTPQTPETDAVTAMRLKKSKAWSRIEKMREYLGNIEHVKGSFYDRLKKSKIGLDELGEYAYALHAGERNKHNAETRQRLFDAQVYDLNQKIADAEGNGQRQKRLKAQLDDILAQKDPKYALMPDGGSGMTNERAKEIIDKVGQDPAKKAQMDDFLKEYRENITDKILEIKHESNQLSDADYEHLKNYYEHYVPLKVKDELIYAEEAANEDNFTSKKKSAGKGLFPSKGAIDREAKDRNNPLLQAAADLERSLVNGEDNKANVRLSNMIQFNPNDKVWEVVPAKYDVIKDANGNTVKAVEDINAAPKTNDSQVVLAFNEEGKRSYIVLKDKGLVLMHRKLGTNWFDRAYLTVSGSLSHLFTKTSTLLNPAFSVKNLFYDQFGAAKTLSAIDPEMGKNFRSYRKSMGSLIADAAMGREDTKWGKWIEDWKTNGGEITFAKAFSSQEHAKQSSKIFENYDKVLTGSQVHRLFSKYEKAVSAIETATRVMAYRASVEAEATKISTKEGISKQEALEKVNREKSAIVSRNSTVDFEKKGVYGQYIAGFRAFANAGIQGVTNTIYLMRRHPAAMSKILGAAVFTGLLESEIGRLFGDKHDDSSPDSYLGQSEANKSKFYMIPMKPLGGHGFAKIPMSREYGWFNYVGKKTGELLNGDIHPGEFIATTLGALSDYYDPTGGSSTPLQKIAGNLSTAAGWYENKNRFGRPIHPFDKAGVFASESYFPVPSTSQAYIDVAKDLHKFTGGNADKEGLIEISPDILQYLVQSTFGGLGSFISGSLGVAKNVISGEHVKADDIPIVKDFYTSGANLSRVKDNLYRTVDISQNRVLTEKEQTDLDRNINLMVEHGQTTEEKAKKLRSFVKGSQSHVRESVQKRIDEGEHSDGESQMDGAGASGTY